MTKVINIQDVIESEKQKKLEEERKRLVEVVGKVMQCSSCRMKCARCGVQVTAPSGCPLSAEVPFSLCPTCAEEYQDYKLSLAGQGKKDIPWHNQEWQEMWKTWIEYQKALRIYQNSEEIKELFRKEQDPNS